MNSTGPTGTTLYSPAIGYVALVVAALGFGTNYIPIKKFNMGDGMFFQWVMGTAVVFVGLIVHCAIGCPKFYPLAMLGGAFWGTGNAMMVTIAEAIGVGLGMLVQSMANMLYGFASSRFGWYGIPSKIPSNPVMNYVGVGIAAGSVIIYAAIRPNHKSDKESEFEMEDMMSENYDSMSYKESTNEKAPGSIIESESELEPEIESGGSRCCKPVSQMPMVQRRIL
ncbi:hypothetical protein AAHC03_04469 [Spirometra sp. Aus1]